MATTQSNLPTVQRLKFEDYSRYTDWKQAFNALVNSLNLFMTPVYNILNGGVTYMNLSLPQLYTVTITATAPLTTFTFTNPLPIQPSAVLVGNVWYGITSQHPAGGIAAVQAFWHYSGNSIVIDNVTGLNAGISYTLTLVIL